MTGRRLAAVTPHMAQIGLLLTSLRGFRAARWRAVGFVALLKEVRFAETAG